MFSIGDNVGIGKPAIWSRRTFEYTCVVYILAVNGPSSGRRVTPPLRAYTFIIIDSRKFIELMESALQIAHGRPKSYLEWLNLLWDRVGYADKKGSDRVVALAYLLPYPTHPACNTEWNSAEDAWADLTA